MRQLELKTAKKTAKETALDNLIDTNRTLHQLNVSTMILEREDDYVVDENVETMIKELASEKLYWEARLKEEELREEKEKYNGLTKLEYDKKQAQEELRNKVKNTTIRKKDGSLNSYTRKAINWCLYEKTKGGKYKVYTKEWVGSGSYYNLIDYTPRILALLGERNYKYTEGNNSKQGGQNTYYILVSKLAYNYIQNELNK